ncbi:methylmalonyl Co-A mutase-associated GTPase MeaB [Thermosipho atlanticus]|uniref:LAO/AO transport system kinase n=1 Tax=Thermosipho atlanticus DSM 15807 TaxID=1123380 RepID=A0A1M5QMG0_9BACT|nr:methylmalonyl Co-A mutase-associated GTPase MeaB [Thermosipho atlanticus]SHH14999.1 LAO/AO transport system kinase [Thermosipho atlanticus DSM 15807]
MKDIIEKMQNRDIRALAKLISYVENNPHDRFVDSLPSTGAKIIGFTGSPGTGKSTLVNKVISYLRKEKYSVGVIAIDPTSPFSGGSFLGDRIRMKTHFLDEKVFIRSMGSGSSLGGLNESIFDVIKLMDAFGFDYVLVETVGAGQSEIDIVYVSDVVVLVLSPGSGDDIQFLKSGIMEIGDIYVINKADLEGADYLKARLEATFSLSNIKKPIIKTIATSGIGVDDLVENIQKVLEQFYKNGEIRKRNERRLKKHAEAILIRKIQECVDNVKKVESVEGIINEVLKNICNK